MTEDVSLNEVTLTPSTYDERKEQARKNRTVLGGFRDGMRTVSVPMSDDHLPEYALVYEEVWHELLNLGMTPHLSKDVLGRPQVNTFKDQRRIPLAWLVADLTSDEECINIDGDPKNCLNNNLLIRTTRKPTRYRDLLSTEHGRARPIVNYEWWANK